MFCPSGRNQWSFPAAWCDLLHAANKKKQINNHRPRKTDTFPFRHNILRLSAKIVSRWKFCPSRWQNLPSPLNVYLVYKQYMNRYRKASLGLSEIGRHMHGCSCRWCFMLCYIWCSRHNNHPSYFVWRAAYMSSQEHSIISYSKRTNSNNCFFKSDFAEHAETFRTCCWPSKDEFET